MTFFISTKTIAAAFSELVSCDYSNQNILFTFLILKGIGLTNLKYEKVALIKKGYEYAQDLGGLFSDLESSPDKYDFINPFMMKSWGENASENLSKWVSSRIKNNVIGGAIKWRRIVMQDANEDYKFTFNYVNEIKDVTITQGKKIPLIPLAIWASRFTEFESKESIHNIVFNFEKRFKLTPEEIEALFNKSSTDIVDIEFSQSLYDTESIRRKIGAPQGNSTWFISTPRIEKITLGNCIFRKFNMISKNEIDIKTLDFILEDYFQLILSGPPGTSKSYLCDELKKNYDKTVHVQFHPQFSYQQFVGGYVVIKNEVIYKKGILTEFIEDIIKSNNAKENKKFLLIIDEINRANTSQVFGDFIQCLDRNNSISILTENGLQNYSIPKNLHIIGTMNTTDRTIGAIDYALKRRFLEVYCGSNPYLIDQLCQFEKGVSLSSFIEKINNKLVSILKNREMVIGHAIFFNSSYNDSYFKFKWDFKKLELLFNYKILPLIEEYCYGHSEQVIEILGEELPKRLKDEEFENAVINYIN